MKPIIATICIIGSLGILFFAAWPEYQDLRESMAYADVKGEDLQNMINYNQTMEAMVSSLETEYEGQIEKIEEGVPDDHYMPSFFAELRRMSYRTGVRIESLGNFTYRDYREREDLKEVEVSFQVQGSYSNFKNFINILQRSARIVEVESLAIEGVTEDSDEQSSLNYTIQILTYSY